MVPLLSSPFLSQEKEKKTAFSGSLISLDTKANLATDMVKLVVQQRVSSVEMSYKVGSNKDKQIRIDTKFRLRWIPDIEFSAQMLRVLRVILESSLGSETLRTLRAPSLSDPKPLRTLRTPSLDELETLRYFRDESFGASNSENFADSESLSGSDSEDFPDSEPRLAVLFQTPSLSEVETVMYSRLFGFQDYEDSQDYEESGSSVSVSQSF